MLHDNIIILCVLKERWSACQHLWSDNFQHKNDINIFFCSCYKHQIYISHAKFNVLIKLLFFFNEKLYMGTFKSAKEKILRRTSQIPIII